MGGPGGDLWVRLAGGLSEKATLSGHWRVNRSQPHAELGEEQFGLREEQVKKEGQPLDGPERSRLWPEDKETR